MESHDSKELNIPDYILLSIVGTGSFGDVWLAKDATGHFCALKIIFDRGKTKKLFLKEFQGLKTYLPISRSHPNLITILHVGISDDNSYYYYTMEIADNLLQNDVDEKLYEPLTLAQKISSSTKPFCISEFCKIAQQLCSAISFLHSNNLVHRDIKPSNIIFVDGVAKLADIGLITNVNDAKTYVGSHGYIAPEGPGKTTADVFSLGKCLYELLYGLSIDHFPEIPTIILKDKKSANTYVAFNKILNNACEPNPANRIKSGKVLYDNIKEASSSLNNSAHAIASDSKALKLSIYTLLILSIITFLFWFFYKYNQKGFSSINHNLKLEFLPQSNDENLLSFSNSNSTNKDSTKNIIHNPRKLKDLELHSPTDTNLPSNNKSIPLSPSLINQEKDLSETSNLKDPNFLTLSPDEKFSINLDSDHPKDKNFRWKKFDLNMIFVPDERNFFDDPKCSYEAAWVSSTEITNKQYQLVTKTLKSLDSKSDLLPVSSISWYEASSYCEKLTYIALENDIISPHFKFCLLSERLWEYCCLATSNYSYSFGDVITLENANFGNFSSNTYNINSSSKRSFEVGTYQPNIWGFYDMHGNVSEWTSENFSMNSGKGEKKSKNKIVKGGSFRSLAEHCKAKWQNHFSPNFKSETIGFRIALLRLK